MLHKTGRKETPVKRTAAFFLKIQHDPGHNPKTNSKGQEEQSATRKCYPVERTEE